MNNFLTAMQYSATHRIVQLILAEQNGDLTPEEEQELDAWARKSDRNRAFQAKCREVYTARGTLMVFDQIDEETALQRFKHQHFLEIYPGKQLFWQRPLVQRWIVAAAITCLVLVAGWWFLYNRRAATGGKGASSLTVALPIMPGLNNAILTLSDGRSISLNDAKDGTVAQDAGATVRKKGAALEYAHTGRKANNGAPAAFNTVSTPRGGFYKLNLPDGSMVWLDALSSIRFPTAFIGKERRVTVTGQAYFEVARAKEPFIVTLHDVDVRVLGTHFNVNGHVAKECVQTTLLEGRVEVRGQGKQVVLKPGQLAESNAQGSTVRVADPEQVVAWKNGRFCFKEASLQDVMREVQRWYAIEVEYIGKPKLDGFYAIFPRTLPLNELLKVMEATDRVRFSMKDNKVIISTFN